MPELPSLFGADLFDEAGYLRLHPGIRTAVANGQFTSGRTHFDRHGRAEGRLPNDIDADFYTRAYPQVTEVFGPLLSSACAVHYIAYGRARGYLPCAQAERAEVPGGLWTDAPDALDRIDAQEAAGQLTDRQSAMLRAWWADGLLVLDHPASREGVDPAALDVARIFAGACPDVVFECPSTGPVPVVWQPELPSRPAAALDPHFVSAPVRSLILGDPVAEFLRLLLQGRALLAASRAFIRPPVTPARRASMRFACGVPRRFLTALIALEGDVEIEVWKGSHRLPPIAIVRPAAPGLDRATIERDEAAIGTALRTAALTPTVVRLGRGTVAILHPELAHASPPLPPLASAHAVVAELCPEVLMPLYGELVPIPLHRHGSDRFASGVYRDFEPLM